MWETPLTTKIHWYPKYMCFNEGETPSAIFHCIRLLYIIILNAFVQDIHIYFKKWQPFHSYQLRPSTFPHEYPDVPRIPLIMKQRCLKNRSHNCSENIRDYKTSNYSAIKASEQLQEIKRTLFIGLTPSAPTGQPPQLSPAAFSWATFPAAFGHSPCPPP